MKPAAVVFDLFGTLLDIASLQTAAAVYCDDPRAFVATWREKQLGYAFAATLMDRYEDFDRLTLRALHYAAARHGLSAIDRSWERLASEWCNVHPFDDAANALADVRAAGIPTAVLTNGTLITARAALGRAGLADAVDVTLSVDSVRAYKPDRRVYESATAHFAVAPQRLTFVTSNGWDATGAAEFGLDVIWCNRANAPAETFGAAPAHAISSLRDLAPLIA